MSSSPGPAPGPAPDTALGSPGTFDPLRNPVYRRVWSASLVSSIGTFLQLVAAPWLMNELTGSPFLVSAVTAALLLPRLALTLPAGALADAIDRRNLLLGGNALGASAVAVMAVMAANDALGPTALLALTAVLGVGSAIAQPAFHTLVPDLVAAPLRAQAITLTSAAFNVARAIGPSIGGALVAAGLTATAFGLNALTSLGVIAVVARLPRQAIDDTRTGGVWRATTLGLRYVRFTPTIRVLVALTAGFALTTAGVQALLPNIVSDELGLGATGFGLLYGAFGLGALGGAVTRDRVRLRTGRAMLPGSVLTFGVSGVVFGLSDAPLLSALALAVAGLTWVWTLTTLNASVQVQAPRWVRGRVVSLYILAVGVQPIGALLSGALAEWTGPGTSVALFSAATVLVGIAAFRTDLPVLGDLSEPVAPDHWTVAPHAEHVGGSPILVATTWQLDPVDLEPFLDLARQLRRERLRTGAHRWALYRDADDPYRITELFMLQDWDEHLAQHARLDQDAAAVIAAARALDRTGSPTTRHLAGLDVIDPSAPPLSEQMLTRHAQMHRQDGSVPLTDAEDG